MTRLKQFALSFVVFLAIDMLWLGVIASNLYADALGELMAENIIWPAALLFYVLFVVGLLYFAVIPALQSNDEQAALTRGALFGFFTYMTYELTNYAVIADWPASLVPIDITWGTLLGGSVSWLTWRLLQRKV